MYSVTKDKLFKDYAHKFLMEDFGDAKKYKVASKFSLISASRTIEPEKHSASNLSDSNWAYGAYWSTYKFPTELKVEFNRRVNDLAELVLVSTKLKIKDTDFDFFVMRERKWEQLRLKLVDEYLHKTRHHKALVLKYVLAEKQDGIKEVKIVFNKRNNGNVLAFREINFHYNMSIELEKLIKYLDYK